MPLISFHAPLEYYDPRGFLTFSEGMKKDYLHEMDKSELYITSLG